jgi:type IV pilus assembly protein PilM
MALLSFSNDFLTIDIGFRYIKIVQVRKKKNNDMVIINYGIGDTPKGCIKNGAIKDQKKVIIEIKKVMSDHSLAAKEAKIVMSGTNIITRIIMIDKVPDEQFETKVWSEIKAYLPVNFEEHTVDYKVLGTVKEGDREKTKIFITAVNKSIIGSYLEILHSLNLKPIAVDTPANSVSKFFQKELRHREAESTSRKARYARLNTNAIAVIDLGSETSIVNILKNKTPEFNRVLLLGSSNIDTSIFKELNMEDGQLDKAERYKKMYGLVKTMNNNNELEWQCSEAARKIMDDISKNIKACFDFYISRCAGEQISKIYLVGGGSQLKGIKEYFEDVLNAPVYPINTVDVEGVEFQSGLDTEKKNFLINSIGIAL